MIQKTSILQNLGTLERLYNSATSPQKALFYAKLAVMEVSGWVEESMDDIVQRCANRNLRDPASRSFVERSIIKPIHGFDYHNHFRQMLMRVIGLITVEKVEKRLDQTKLVPMQAALRALAIQRNTQAHTHLKGTTITLDAPSVTNARFNEVYEGLKNFDNELRKLK